MARKQQDIQVEIANPEQFFTLRMQQVIVEHHHQQISDYLNCRDDLSEKDKQYILKQLNGRPILFN